MDEITTTNDRTGFEIAVIGMAGRFPGAKNITEFWENLKNGIESITFFSDEELNEIGVSPQRLESPNYVKAKGILEDIDYFDVSFFDYNPREGEMMDPQLRILHEVCWEALENAAYDPDRYSGLIGMYAGASLNPDWFLRFFQETKSEANLLHLGNLVAAYTFCTRISYKLNLKGPSITVECACSTSLTAIHIAVQGLLCGECDMALAGGVSIVSLQKEGYLYQEGMILSPDGHCRTFDGSANGTVWGDGAGIAVLKRLADAQSDGDNILAVIKGSAINNDGNQKVGYMAPSMKAQSDVITSAYRLAGIAPETVGYIETHGTGTSLGDPIEISALKKAFNTGKKGFCRIGSVKSNMGHLNNGAGIAGFIKTVLVLMHRLIPPSLHYNTPNPEIDFENSPFLVNRELFPWEKTHCPRRAGVSAFGGGGTNVHVILEECPEDRRQETENRGQKTGDRAQSQGRGGVFPPGHSREYQLILLSAKTETSLGKATGNFLDYLQENPGINFADAAYTLQVGRKHFQYRRMLVCSHTDEAVAILSSPGSGKLFTQEANLKEKTREIVFMFPGQGAQYVNMGLGLYRSERVFREEMDRCFEIYRSLTGSDIKEILYPTHPAPSGYPSQEVSRGGSPYPPRDCVGSPLKFASNSDQINQTAITQPVIFMFEYALGKMLFHWGIQPTVMIGYSFGEYTAACLAGVFSLEDAIRLVTLRGRLMQQMPEGSMLSVPLPADELKPLLNDKLSIAIDNGPSCVVSAAAADIDEFAKEMKKKRYLCIRVTVSHAGHSPVLHPILKEFAEAMEKVELKEPQIPYISNVTAAPITGQEVKNPNYWLRHLKDTVRFGEGIAGLLTIPDALFIEIGPGRDLCVLLKSFKGVKATHRMINLVRHEKEDAPDLYYLLNKLGHLWLYGADIDWKGFYADEQRRRLPLPTYSFDRQYFKIGKIPLSLTAETGKNSQNPLKRVEDIDKWLYIPSWKRSRLPRSAEMFTQPQQMQVLLFMDECGLGDEIAERLRQQGYRVVLVRVGEAFTRINEDEYSIHPAASKDYEALFQRITGPGLLPPLAIFHLWNVTPISAAMNEPAIDERVEKEQEKGFFSLITLVRTLGQNYPSEQIQVKVVTNNVQDVLGDEVICPGKATVLGPVKCIIQEFSHIDCCAIDIQVPEPGSSQEQQLLNRLVEEFKVRITDRMIAYRRNHRWVQSIEPMELAKAPGKTVGLKEEGIYLVTGGLGGIGLLLAEYLAREVKARLVLTGRSQFPPREEWDHWLTGHDPEEKISRQIRKIRELEALGARVLVASADVANFQQMREVITRAEQQFGKINGVIHAAGLPDGSLIIQRTREMSEEILAPKVTGTLVLNQLLKDTGLDFFIFCSSMASLLPPGGQTAYAAANAFLDAFAHSSTSNNGRITISINWDRWQNTGVAVILEKQHRDLWGAELVEGITPAEGIELFKRILADPLPQVAVCPLDLIPALREYYKTRGVPFADSYKSEVRHDTIHQRPQLTVEYVEPGSNTEKKLAEVWQNFLGINCVGIYDNFFELGATSMDIIQVNGRLADELKKDIPLVSMYSYPTVKLLAEFIDQGNGKKDFLDKGKEKRTFEARDKGEEKKKNLRMIRREAR